MEFQEVAVRSNIEIARDAKMKPIARSAAKLGIRTTRSSPMAIPRRRSPSTSSTA